MAMVLKEFNAATKLISGSKYPTSNLYFHQICQIKILLEKENSEEVAADVSGVLKVMKKKFTKYWKKSYISLCVPVIFDPRYKLKFIKFLFMGSFPTTARSKLNRLESLVKQLFFAYSSPSTNVDPSQFLFMGSFPTTARSKLNRLESLVKQLFFVYSSPSTNVDPSQMDGANYDMPVTTNGYPWTTWDQQLTIWIYKLKCLLSLIDIWMRISFQDLRNLTYCSGGGAIVQSTQSFLT
jgi:hypothetical protein